MNNLTLSIQKSLHQTLGYTYSPDIQIKSELTEDIDKLMQALTLWVSDGSTDLELERINDLSLGGANLIYMTLKLLEYEFKQSKEEKVAHFLLIEEPEAHIHTHIQKTLFDRYQFDDTQIIITTHSTHISSASKISSMNILSKETNQTYVSHPSLGIGEKECKKIERYLDSTRSTLLFAKSVVLVEGDAELILIPQMFKVVFGLSLDELGISIINMSSTVFEHVARLFDDKRLHRSCAIITDSDNSLILLPDDSSLDTKEQSSAREAENSGRQRKDKLEIDYKDNPWVQIFYSEHTFEVDFVLAGNKYEICETLPEIYNREVHRKRSKHKIKSADDSISGLETLRLAKKVGKGWFALLVCEQLTNGTIIPDYILCAFAFVMKRVSFENFKKMAEYRIEQESFFDFSEEEEKNNLEILSKINSITDMYQFLKDKIPEDILTDFIAKVIAEKGVG